MRHHHLCSRPAHHKVSAIAIILSLFYDLPQRLVPNKYLGIHIKLVIFQVAGFFWVSLFDLYMPSEQCCVVIVQLCLALGLTCLINFLSSCLHSLVRLDKSSVTMTLAFLRTFANLNTVSLSLNDSKVTKTGRHPLTSGPDNLLGICSN